MMRSGWVMRIWLASVDEVLARVDFRAAGLGFPSVAAGPAFCLCSWLGFISLCGWLGVLSRGGRLGFTRGLGGLRLRARHRSFLNNILGRFVLAQPMEHRVAHRAFAGHLRIGHFRQQFGFEPVHASSLGSGRRVDHRLGPRRQRLEPGENSAQSRLAEARPHLAGIAQLAAVGVVQAQQQSTKAAAATLGIGIADHHELLPVLAFELDPVLAARGAVRAADALADQPFHLHLAGAVQQRGGRFVEVVGIAQGVGLMALKQFLQAARRCSTATSPRSMPLR